MTEHDGLHVESPDGNRDRFSIVHPVPGLGRDIGTGREPDIEGGEIAPGLPLAKIGLGLERGHLFGNRGDEELVHRHLFFLRHLTGIGEQ
ncbi:hypothetical protein THIOKS12390005 [Thiocapsa sp. KS1]|nr:hypothetical protein THIOKS12390005 [Thiocapsa sp. KS1]